MGEGSVQTQMQMEPDEQLCGAAELAFAIFVQRRRRCPSAIGRKSSWGRTYTDTAAAPAIRKRRAKSDAANVFLLRLSTL